MWKDNHSRSFSPLRQRDDEDDEDGDDGDEEDNDDGDDEGDDDGEDDVEQWEEFHDDYGNENQRRNLSQSVFMLNEDVIMEQPKLLTHAT